MQLFDELSAILHDLPSEGHNKITRALSRLGIHVDKSSGTSPDEISFRLFVELDVDDVKIEDEQSQRAQFDSLSRRWSLVKPSPRDPGQYAAKLRQKRRPRDDGEVKLPQSPWQKIREKNDLNTAEQNSHAEDNDLSDFPRFAPGWTEQLPSTPHVEFLKSRDWASTELGPIQLWPPPLRFMTRKMLADPRPANLYW